MLISLLVVLVIFCLVIWIIGLIPFPQSNFPLKTILYIIACIALIAYLIRYL